MMMMSKVSSSENTTVAAAATEADDIIISQKEILTSKAEISEIKQENERLKMKLSQVIKDYRSLQTQFDHQDDPKLQMSLSLGDLGRCGSSHLHTEEEEEEEEVTKHGEEKFEQELGLQLGLNIGFENKTKEKQEEQEEEEEKKEGWVTRKILKNMRSKRGDDDDEFSYNPIKKARVSVRTRYDGIMMNDGCQWRKYGQKVAKGNPCPRSYYRCTAAPECPVRKQVQRFVEDMSILTTTYEGKHNHPLSEAASSMAKTTSMAMNMLLSKSSQSKAGGTSLAPISTITSINGVNYSLTTNNIPHLSTISPSHPTITLDLTLSQSSSSSSSSSSSPLQQNQWRRLGLMSSNTTATGGLYQFESIPNKILNLNYQGQAQQQSFYKSHAGLSDTITVATKAIALDPSFQSALAATVASVLGARGGGAGEMGRRIEGLKMEDRILSSLLPNYLPSSSSSSTTLNTNLLLTQHQNQHNHRRHHPASIPFSNHMNNEHGRSPFSANRE